jgi:preprotein translocase subunit YajC
MSGPGIAFGPGFGFAVFFDFDFGMAGPWVGRSLSGPAHVSQAAERENARSFKPFGRIPQRCNWPTAGYIPRTFRAPPERLAPPGHPPNLRDFMFISPAFAQAASPFGGDNMLVSLLPFILIFVIMYFLILRPQQKRAKQHTEMVKNVRRGDTVVTSGGLVGKVTKVIDDDQIEVELAEDVRVRQMRSMVADVRAKGEPVKEGASS